MLHLHGSLEVFWDNKLYEEKAISVCLRNVLNCLMIRLENIPLQIMQ